MPANEACSNLTDAISEAMVGLYGEVYEHCPLAQLRISTTTSSYASLKTSRVSGSQADAADGKSSQVMIDERAAFQKGAEHQFTAAIERLTGRDVTAFMSANQTSPGIVCEMFFLGEPPLTGIPA